MFEKIENTFNGKLHTVYFKKQKELVIYVEKHKIKEYTVYIRDYLYGTQNLIILTFTEAR